ncbi:MAG: lysostaphin resistance A-like protein [Burkholderiales bacterium]
MPEAAAQCAACQRPLRAGTLFCPGCGQTLDGSAPEPHRPRDDGAARSRFAEHWEELKRIGWLFGLLLATSLVYGLASPSDTSPWPLVVASAIDALIVLVAAGLRWRKLLFLFRIHPIGARRWMEILAVSLAFVGLMTLYFGLLERLGVPFSQATETLSVAGWPLWSMLVLVSLMPAFFEELAFRGVIQSSLERIFNARDAWLIQAALFSLLHLSPIIFPSHFVMGLCFGLMRMRSRSLYPGMLLHAAWNALVVFQEVPA